MHQQIHCEEHWIMIFPNGSLIERARQNSCYHAILSLIAPLEAKVKEWIPTLISRVTRRDIHHVWDILLPQLLLLMYWYSIIRPVASSYSGHPDAASSVSTFEFHWVRTSSNQTVPDMIVIKGAGSHGVRQCMEGGVGRGWGRGRGCGWGGSGGWGWGGGWVLLLGMFCFVWFCATDTLSLPPLSLSLCHLNYNPWKIKFSSSSSRVRVLSLSLCRFQDPSGFRIEFFFLLFFFFLLVFSF